ncbi:unnamed protein product [Rotaria sordida]|uniref:C2H2-type domain-containing protein n=1 Tax=Rotaria sordida TaxID=392033 RepID=A0A813T8L0_9BILA|nr:unnamed protein product [Rotaria sordida]CAF3502385.1 unnamed protein product [Rotaria sordida]
MISDNTEDLFICGKCRTNFTDLNTFLTHRSTCNIQQSSNLFPLSNNSSSILLEKELDAIIQDVSLTISSTPNFFDESIHTEVSPTNEFDLLFSQPVEQNTIHNEIINTNVSNPTESSFIENGISQMSLLECPVCDEQFDAPIILENHVFEHSTWIDENESTNSKLGLPFDDSSSSYTDLLDEQSNIPLECKQCTVTFASNASLNIHKKMIHCLQPVFRCLNDTCSQLFDKPVDYILHARIHSQKRHMGTRRSTRSTVYNRHRKRTYRCRICKTCFQTSEQLQYHMHNETHKFLCQLCPAEFESNNSYHNHIAKHSDLALYRCTICIESFQKRNDLSRHVITQHNEDLPNQKSCSTCNLTFKTTFHLNRHNVTKHSNIKPFKCEEDGCEQAFARKDKLKQHAAKHTASGGLFKCHACVKTFVRPEHLRDHDIVRHSHQYPFRCEVCRKGFLHKTQLYTHHKQHHSIENQTMTEDIKFFTFDQTQEEQGFSNYSTNLFLEQQ